MADETEVDSSLFPSPEDLKNAQSAWSGGQTAAAEDEPQGTFQLRIVEAALGRSLSSGRLQITWELEIAAGDKKGLVLRKYDGLETDHQAKITQQGLKRIGVKVKSLTIEQLPAVLVDLKDKVVTALCKKNGDFYNINFQKMAGEAVGSSTSGRTSSAGSRARSPAGSKPAGSKPKF